MSNIEWKCNAGSARISESSSEPLPLRILFSKVTVRRSAISELKALSQKSR